MDLFLKNQIASINLSHGLHIRQFSSSGRQTLEKIESIIFDDLYDVHLQRGGEVAVIIKAKPTGGGGPSMSSLSMVSVL